MRLHEKEILKVRFSIKISFHIYKYEWCKHSLYGEIKSKISITINLRLRSGEMVMTLAMEKLNNLISKFYFKIFKYKNIIFQI